MLAKSQNIPTLKYGTVTEPVAASVQQMAHKNLTVAECGLFILPEHVYAATSPDHLILLTCWREGLLEVKCPLSAINKPVDNVNVAYLQVTDGKTGLKHGSQVRYQTGVTDRHWCDFFVYTSQTTFWSVCHLSQRIIYANRAKGFNGLKSDRAYNIDMVQIYGLCRVTVICRTLLRTNFCLPLGIMTYDPHMCIVMCIRLICTSKSSYCLSDL